MGFRGQQGETSCLIQSSPRRNLFRVHRTGVFDPSLLHGRAAGEVLQRPHCGCNTSQVQQGIGISEVKWEKRRFFLIMVEGMWRAYYRPTTSCFLWVLLLVIFMLFVGRSYGTRIAGYYGITVLRRGHRFRKRGSFCAVR